MYSPKSIRSISKFRCDYNLKLSSHCANDLTRSGAKLLGALLIAKPQCNDNCCCLSPIDYRCELAVKLAIDKGGKGGPKRPKGGNQHEWMNARSITEWNLLQMEKKTARLRRRLGLRLKWRSGRSVRMNESLAADYVSYRFESVRFFFSLLRLIAEV